MSTRRIQSYDVVRGVLLIGMVVFHILTNLTSLGFEQHHFYWVPLGFVFFLGVLLARFLQGKTRKKLLLAGKLLALYLLFNLPHIVAHRASWLDFLQGNQEVLSFEILLPMVVVIGLSIVLDRILRWNLWAVLGLWSVLLLLSATDTFFYNLSFTLYGVIGYALASSRSLDVPPASLPFTVGAVVLAVLPTVGIALGWFFDGVILLQVLALYVLAARFLDDVRPLAELGRQSLVLYVGHIVVLAGLARYVHLTSAPLIIGFTVLFLGMLYGVAVLLDRRSYRT